MAWSLAPRPNGRRFWAATVGKIFTLLKLAQESSCSLSNYCSERIDRAQVGRQTMPISFPTAHDISAGEITPVIPGVPTNATHTTPNPSTAMTTTNPKRREIFSSCFVTTSVSGNTKASDERKQKLGHFWECLNLRKYLYRNTVELEVLHPQRCFTLASQQLKVILN